MSQNAETRGAAPLRVLFLCAGNSCRSPMAEGWARHALGDRVQVDSAGTHPSVVNPRAIQVMREAGVDISSHRSKAVDEFIRQEFDLIITLCDDAEASCPVFSGRAKRIQEGLPDPALAVGLEREVLMVCRQARDRIRKQVIPILEKELLRSTSNQTI